MKRLIASFLFVCCFTLLLSGCKQSPIDGPDNTSGQTQPTTQPATQPTQASTQPTTQPTEPIVVEDIEGPLAQYVQTAIKEKYQLFDKYGYGELQQESTLRVPKLLPFSEDAIAAQTEMEGKLNTYITDVRESYAEGLSASTKSIDYNAYLNDNVLSVVIEAESMFDLCFYLVYNFDIETGKRLDTEGLMTKLSILDYTEKFTQVAKNAYEEKYQGYQNKDELYNTQLATTVSKENIDKAMPYVAEDGKIKVILNIYSLAGAEYYPQVVSLS